MSEQRWRRADKWHGVAFEDGLVMLEVELGTYVGLNDTASAVWEAIERPATRDDVVGCLLARFDVPADRCADAVTATLEKFRAVGLAVAI